MSEVPSWLAAFGNDTDASRYISDLDIDERVLQKPLIVTFFSLRGGVGRSTALANTAILLSNDGYNVVCLDADFEAPSLDKAFSVDYNDSGDGLLHSIINLETDNEYSKKEILSRIIKVNDNDLYLFPSGKINEEYIKSLNWLDTEVWYSIDHNPFQKLINIIKDSPISPDFILIDSRTGMAQINAPFLFRESDLVVNVMTPSEQSIIGNEILAKGLKNSTNYSGRRIDIRYVLSPLAQNYNYAGEAIAKGKGHILDWWGDYFTDSIDDYVVPVFYDEKIATSPDCMSIQSRISYVPISNWLSSLFPSEYENLEADFSSNIDDKRAILDEIQGITERNSGIAEQDQDINGFFIENNQYGKIINKRTSIIIGRKGTGKTALFRHFVSKYHAIPLSSPRRLQDVYPTSPTRIKYSNWAKNNGNTISSWRKFWLLQLLNVLDQRQDAHLEYQDVEEDVIAGVFSEILSMDAREVDKQQMIIADGLDDGFGSDPEEFKVRDSAISGLIDFWYQYATFFKNYTFKFFIRYDLWEKIDVVNKSHLESSSVTIQWKEEDYLAVITKLVAQSKRFCDFYAYSNAPGANFELVQKIIDPNIAWNMIFGERMDTGKAAFTKTWVWKRLSDSNGEHSVRMLINLLKYSVLKEIKETRRYRALVRPKNLISALPDVSQQALISLKEEFNLELGNLIERLKEIDNTPFKREILKDFNDNTVNFASEVGLLEERNDGRLSIPDLFRHSLNISRRGLQ